MTFPKRPQWLAMALWLVACGQEQEQPVDLCSAPFEACGGNAYGNWQVYTMCADQGAIAQVFDGSLPPECAGSLRSAALFPADLRVQFETGSSTISGWRQLHLEYDVGAACAAALAPDFGTPSAESCALLEGDAPEGGKPNLEEGIVECTLVEAGCSCDSVRNDDVFGTATFTTVGTDLILGENALPYCVSGDTLTYLDAFGPVRAKRLPL
jgi:hypothetical protein